MSLYCRHVYRIGAEPEFAARHPAARELSRRRQDQKTHHCQSVGLAGRTRRGAATLLKGGTATPADQEIIIVRRALPHGHVAAVLGMLGTTIGLDRILGPAGNR